MVKDKVVLELEDLVKWIVDDNDDGDDDDKAISRSQPSSDAKNSNQSGYSIVQIGYFCLLTKF